MFNLKEEVIRHIIIAQMASDNAKGNVVAEYKKMPEWAKIKDAERSVSYDIKDKAIKKALSLLTSSKEAKKIGITFYARREADQNGNPSNIIYFNINDDEKKYQVSFHNFRREIRFGYAESRKGLACHWNGKNGGSREAVIELIKKYKG